MKVLYLAELNPMVCNGGGESILMGIIKKGSDLGFEITIKTPNDKVEDILALIKSSDLIICADMDNEPRKTPRTWFNEVVFETLIDSKKYVTFATGYCDACRQDYTPCNVTGRMDCPDCPKKDMLRRSFYRNARQNWFLSPLQRDATLNHFDIGQENSHICIPEIDTSIFYNYNGPRDIDYIICGVICPAKGYFKICEYIEEHKLQDKNIIFLGRTLVGKPKYGEWIQHVDRNDVAKILNRSKWMLNLPTWPEAFCLSACEAALCGCEIIANKNLGATSCFSYNLEELKNTDNFNGNYEKFWQEVKTWCKYN